jgi:uncharacterized protein (TIGR03435 family)
MERSGNVNGIFRRVMLSGSGFLVASLPILISPLTATPSQIPREFQTTPTNALAFRYEVVTIKPSKPPSSVRVMIGITGTPDGLTAQNSTIQSLINEAYGTQDFQIIGSPSWLNSEMYDMEAKMDGSVSDALQKLSPAERKLARQKMLQAILVDRMKLIIHRDYKESAVYNLIVERSGAKLHAANPDDTYPNGFKTGEGEVARGMMQIDDGVGSKTMTAQGIGIASLVETLSGLTGRTAVDKTGLTGKYDFSLKWKPDDSQADTTGPSLFTAIREQLGLKLEPGKSVVEIIVIDHVERPSGN